MCAGLLELDVSGCPWASVSALCQAVCPCLRLLDLSRVEELKDSNLRELLAPPNADTRSSEYRPTVGQTGPGSLLGLTYSIMLCT